MSTNATSNTVLKFKTVADLREAILSGKQPEVLVAKQAYADRMLQPVPNIPTVKDRAAYLVDKSKDQVVLDIGCTGVISEAIRKVAKGYHGVDAVSGDWDVVDLDVAPESIPVYPDVTLVIMSEVIEHLTNPGNCLRAVKKLYPNTSVILSVPQAGAYNVVDDAENVNKDHVAWYSYSTLTRLLQKVGFTVTDMRWYNGQPHKAEGLIALARTD